MKTMLFGLWVGEFYFENPTEDLMCGETLQKSRLQMGGTLFNAQKMSIVIHDFQQTLLCSTLFLPFGKVLMCLLLITS